MDREPRSVVTADLDGLAAIAGYVRDWEPQLGLSFAPRQGVLFDSQGTLYAVMLGDRAELYTDRRRQEIVRGDLVVVPPGIGIEVEPEADFLLLCDDGRPPTHFRERFIQIWGFDHLTELSDPDAEGRLRRVSCNWITLATDEARELPPADWDTRVLVRLDGPVDPTDRADASAADNHRPTVTLIPAGSPARVSGPGRMALLSFPPEAIHQERLRTRRVT